MKKNVEISPKIAGFHALLNDEQASKYLGFKNPNSLKNMRSRGYGPKFVRLGRFVRYRIEDLDKYIDENLVDPAA